ncbi:MAG: hypothetical protein B7Z55_16735, partial [Planctomycetales bacterium 12-60-4]
GGLGWYGGFGPGYYTGTTPAESYARGQAEMIRAQGEAYRAAAAGAIDYEQARASYMENQLRWHQIQLERRQMGEQERQEHYAAERAARERRNSSAEPPPAATSLSDSQYDRGTGTITWPEVLQANGFANGRTEVEELLKLRARTGNTNDVSEQIYDATSAMLTQLKQQVKSLPPTGYIEARKFLTLLMSEVQPPVG